jgi:hypothetical protein
MRLGPRARRRSIIGRVLAPAFDSRPITTLGERLCRALYLATLALVPWAALAPFPWLHENARWSDALFALAFLAWLATLALERRLPRPRAVHAGLALYLGWAALSLVASEPRHPSGPAKLVGLCMLVALFVVTSDLVDRRGMPAAIGRTIAATSLVTALAALVGVVLSGFGLLTPLVGTCGDLLPGPLSRAQAGFPHPNLLASFCVFAAGVVAREDSGLSGTLRLVVTVALALTVLLTTSRAILAFGLAAAIRHASSEPRRRFAWGLAAVLVAAMIGFTLVNLTFQPLRPWDLQLREGPSVRLASATTSFETLAEHPVFGSGLGSSPGRRGSLPFDAHLTPLNVAATLGLPALAGLAFAVFCLWRGRARPTDLATWGMLAGLALDGLGQDIEDFRHVWVALGLADAGRAAGERAA